MKIIQVTGMESGKYGGLEYYFVELARQLSSMGHKVFFIYEAMPTHPKYIQDLEATGATIKIIRSRNRYLGFCLNFIQFLWEIKPDVVHTHFMNSKFFALPIALLMRIPLIVQTLHSGIQKERFSKKTMLINKFFLNSRIYSIAVSEGVNQQFVNACNIKHNKLKTHYLGVPANPNKLSDIILELPFDPQQKVILCIGNFNQIKGLDVLVKAVAIIKERELLQNFKVVIVGQPDNEIESLQQLCLELRVQDEIQMLGIRSDVAKLLRGATLYVQPSRTEGIPLAIMEALAAGLPIIGTDVGGIPEAIQNEVNGFLIQNEDEQALANAISLILNNENLRLQMSEASLKMSQKFNIEHSVSALLSKYNELIQN